MSNAKVSGQGGTNWTSSQAYTMAVLCLLVGLAAGYLVRGSSAPSVAPVSQQATPTAAAGAPGGVGASQVSPEQMKRMAEAQAQPLLARLKTEPNNAALPAEIGNIYYDTQQYQEAIRYYGDSLKLNPANADVRTDMGTAYYYMGDSDRALQEFNASLKYNPTHAQTLFNMGMVKWQGKMDSAGALAAWQQLLKANPNYPERAKVEELIAQVREHQNIPPGTTTSKAAK